MAAANWVTEDMLDAIRQVESGGNNNAVSPRGAVGQYQFLPENVHNMGYGVKKGFDPLDPVASRAAAKAYLTGMKKFHGFTNDQTLQAYNYGPTRMAEYLKKGSRASASEIDNNLPTETIEYLDKVGAEMNIAERERLIREYAKQGNAKYPQGMRPISTPTNPLVSNNAVLSGHKKPNTRGFIGEFVEESMVPAIKDLYGSMTGGSQVPVDPRGNKLLEEMGIAPQTTVPTLPGPQSSQSRSKGLTPYSLMPSASSIFIDPFIDSAGTTARKFGDHVGGVVDNLVTATSAAGNMVYDAAGNLVDTTESIASNLAEGFTNSNAPTPVAPIQQKPALTNQQQALLSGNNYIPAPSISPEEAAEQSRQNAVIKERINSVLEPANNGNTDSPKDPDIKPVEPIDITKTKSGSIYDNLLPETKTAVPAVKEKVKPVVDPIAIIEEAAENPFEDGLPGKTSLDPKKGIVTDNEGNRLDIPEDQVKDIFGKVAAAFGDIFSGPDLKRMALYTIGGVLSGGSLKGSFQWAGMKVMEEQGQAKIAQAKLDEKTLDNERLVARETQAQDYKEETATNLFARQSAAAAAVAQALQDHRSADGEAKIEAARVLAAAQLAKTRIDRLVAADKLRKDDKTGDLTGDTEVYTVEGLKGVTSITAEKYYITNTSKGWRVPNPFAGQENQPAYVSREQFRQYLTSPSVGGSWQKGDPELASVTEEQRVNRIATFSHDMRQEVVKLYGDGFYEEGLLAASTMERYFQERGYDLGDTRTAAIAREIATRAAVESSNDARDPNNDKRGTTLPPYMDKYAFSTAALAQGSGVWAIEGGNRTINASKVEALVSKFRSGSKGKQGTRENHQAAMNNFTSWYERYTNLKTEDKIPKLVYDNKTSNEFYAWLQSKLKSGKVTDTE